MAKLKGGLLEKLVPVLLVASIGLAFAVGVLWQKVSQLEGGGTKVPTTTTGANDSGNAAAQPQAASKLSNLEGVVSTIGVDVNKYKSCVEAGKYKDRVENDYQGGIQAGVQGTPGSFIVNKKGEVWFVAGAYPYESVKQVIDMALGKGTGTLPQGVEKYSADKAAKLPKLTSSDHVRGDRNADVLLIEYSDFQCPFCQRFHPTAQQALDENKEVALVYRHFPLDQLHPLARPAALASECVAEIGGDEAFWKFADEVFGS